MTFVELWLQSKEFFIDAVKYGFPTLALLLSILSYRDSRQANKVQERLNEVEEKLKKYELEDKEKEREEATRACVEARIMKISKNNYRMKIWNSGKATAHTVDFEIQAEYKDIGFVFKDHVPFEFLEAGKSFEEYVLVHSETPRKFKVTTSWMDKQGVSYFKEQLLTV